MSKITELPIADWFSSKKPTDLYLDLSKWRCGEDGGLDNELGKGETILENKKGYMCCLGQFCKQIGVPSFSLKQVGAPLCLEDEYNHPFFISISDRAMKINDYTDSTIKEKVNKLTALCKEHGVTLHIIDNQNILGK